MQLPGLPAVLIANPRYLTRSNKTGQPAKSQLKPYTTEVTHRTTTMPSRSNSVNLSLIHTKYLLSNNI